MACKIYRNPKTGKITNVTAPNGKSSLLYKSILESMPDNIEVDGYVKEAFQRGNIKALTRDEIALALWSKVYTPTFKRWFGDWEKNPSSASKIVDNNGEPQLVYHGGNSIFNSFRKKSISLDETIEGEKLSVSEANPVIEHGIFFTPNKKYSERYGNNSYPVFLSIKKPFRVNPNIKEEHEKAFEVFNYRGALKNDYIINDKLGSPIQIAVRESSDIKSLFNEGTFMPETQNIYYQLSNEEIGSPAIELENNLTALLNSLGVDVEVVNKIKNKDGKEINAYGKADLVNDVIQLTEGRDITTLPEEAAHMITAMMGKNNPLIKQMMANVNKFPVYKAVKDEYADVYTTEDEFRFEAVGKVIATHLINGVKVKDSTNNNFLKDWFNRLLNKLSQALFSKNIVPLKKSMDAFEQTAKKILDNNIKDIIKPEIKKEGEFYQLGKTQSEIVKQLTDDRKRVSVNKRLDEKGRERYVVDNKIVSERVTDLQSELFTRGKSKKDIEKIQNSPKSQVAKDLGTKLHDINEQLLNFAVNQKDNLQLSPELTINNELPILPAYMSASHLVEIGKSINYLADEIDIQQRKIDPNAKATVITENFVIDENRDIAGSQDVLVIYSDGSVSIYDYKFINFRKEKINNKWIIAPDTQIPFIKEKSYTLQISEYKKILREAYGVTNFRATRILPFNIQFVYDKTAKIPISKVAEIEGFKIEGEKDYLMPLPVAGELTDNPTMNKLLSRLFKKEEELVKKVKDNWSNNNIVQSLKLELGSVKKSIKHIQLLSDITPLIDSVNVSLDNIASGVGNINISNIGELNKMIADIKLFDQIYKEARGFMAKESKHDLEAISKRIADAEIVLEAKLVELLSEFDPNISTPQRELGYFKRSLGYMSQISHPIFRVGWDKIKEARGDTNRDVLAFTNNLEVKVKSLKEWVKGRGISLLDAYKQITNENTGNLIGMFSPEYHEKKEEMRDEGDSKWFKDNFRITKKGEAQYIQDLTQYEKSLKGVGEKYRAFRLESWKNQHDLARDSAWLNGYTLNVYTELKNPEQYHSIKYKELLDPKNKPLKEYYDFYREANVAFNQIVDERIDGTFVANIQKDMIDSLSQGAGVLGSVKNGMNDFIDGMRVRQNDTYLTVDDIDSKIPLLYYDNFMYKDKDGDWKSGASKKNEDLTNNLILFSEAVYRKHHMSKIQDVIESLKLQINNQDVILTDNKGKPVVNKYTDKVETKESAKNAEVFESLTKGLVYGKRIQNKDVHIAAGENVYSLNKIMSNLMSYMSTKSLAFNYVSGFGNLTAGYANTYIKSVGGRYYNSKQMWKSHKLLMNRGDGDLYNHITEFWNVEKDHWVLEKAAKLSASKLTKALTFDKWYILQQKGDEFIANTILVSMMQNYGISENGTVKRLELLPEGTKTLLEKINRKDDKISIDGLSNEAFDQFRNMVRYVSRQVKGTNTSEDLSMIQTTIWGKSIMHFRNWIAPMVKERFGNLEYTKDVQEFEYGRYKSLWTSIINDKFLPNFKRLLIDIATLGRVKYKGDINAIKAQYLEFKKNNPDLLDNITIEDYIALRERTIREAIHEMKIIIGMLILMMAAKGDWDDDGKQDYKQTKITREAYKLLNRAYLELSFFSTPTSVRDLLKAPVPVMQVGVDFINFAHNTTDEFIDIFLPDEKEDKTPIGHYSKRMLPITKPMFDFFDDFNED